MFFLLMIRGPPRSTLFPNTTLFRCRHQRHAEPPHGLLGRDLVAHHADVGGRGADEGQPVRLHHLREARDIRQEAVARVEDRKSTRLNSSHANSSYAVFCLKKKSSHKARTTSLLHVEPRPYHPPSLYPLSFNPRVPLGTPWESRRYHSPIGLYTTAYITPSS